MHIIFLIFLCVIVWAINPIWVIILVGVPLVIYLLILMIALFASKKRRLK